MQDEPLEELRWTRRERNEPAARRRLSTQKERSHERQENDADRRRSRANRRRREEGLVDQDRGRLPEQGRLLEPAVRLPGGKALGDHRAAPGDGSEGPRAADRVTPEPALGRSSSAKSPAASLRPPRYRRD